MPPRGSSQKGGRSTVSPSKKRVKNQRVLDRPVSNLWAKSVAKGRVHQQAIKSRSKKPQDTFNHTLDDELRAIFAELAGRVSYTEFSDDLTVTEFKIIVMSVFYERWWGLTNVDTADVLAITTAKLSKVKKNPFYSVLKKRPDHLAAQTTLGLIHMNRGRFSSARKALQKAI